MENQFHNRRANPPSENHAITPVTMGLAGGLAGSLASSLFKQNTPSKHLRSIVVGAVIGMAGGALMRGKSAQPKRFEALTDYNQLNQALSAAPAQDRITHQEAEAFFHFADEVAKSGKHGALQSVFQELYDKGQAEAAAMLHNYLAERRDTPFVQALDGWLSELGERSPESLQHVQRQAVLMAMLAKEIYNELPPDARAFMVNRALLAGISHDIGKLAIAPELLHKATRIDAAQLESFLAQYDSNVPDYPEKQSHLQFIRMVNGGRVAFGDVKGEVNDLLSVDDVIDRVTRKPLLGEPEFADDQMKASSAAIYHQIRQKALSTGLAIPPEMEADLLNHGKRGTLTVDEIMLMQTHDKLGVAMLEKVGLPAELGLSSAVIDMDKQVDASQLPQDLAQLREWVKLTDMFEATTGQRAYNRENGKNLTPDEAMQVLDNAAKFGAVDAGALAQFKQSGVAEAYAKLYADIPKSRDINQPQSVINAKAAQLQETLNQSTTINR